MTEKNLLQMLKNEGYTHLRKIPGRGIVGLKRFMFTTGLVYNLTEDWYDGRYCYRNHADALKALENWNGEGDPDDEDWIKHKGGKEYSNPKRKKEHE